MQTIRVRAVEGRLVQMLRDDGRIMFGAYVGRKPDVQRTIITKGVVLPRLPQWMRIVADEDLELVKPDFKPGDVVVLDGQEPEQRMTVTKLTDAGIAHCAWSDAEGTHEGDFDANLLVAPEPVALAENTAALASISDAVTAHAASHPAAGDAPAESSTSESTAKAEEQ